MFLRSVFKPQKILKMSKNLAIVVQKAGEAKVTEVTVPKLRDDYLIVKTKAIALNPTDWKHVDFVAPAGTRVSSQGQSSGIQLVTMYADRMRLCRSC